MKQEEHNMQVACVCWFRMQYSVRSALLFAVPNGGRRDRVTGAKLKAEGTLAGVADMLLLCPSSRYHGLCIEFKTQKGRQSEAQKTFQRKVEGAGYAYCVVRSIGDFMNVVAAYFRGEAIV